MVFHNAGGINISAYEDLYTWGRDDGDETLETNTTFKGNNKNEYDEDQICYEHDTVFFFNFDFKVLEIRARKGIM